MAARRQSLSKIPVALVYPNASRVGLSNLGFQFVSRLWDAHPQFSVQGFFFELEEAFYQKCGRVVSQTSSTCLSAFPIIAFSLPFENDYPAVLKTLLNNNIPCMASQRGLGDPLVLAGGVSISLNPEPLAPFFDVIFVGEIDEANGWTKFLDTLAAVHTDKVKAKTWNRSELYRFKDVPGAYVPEAYQFRYGEGGILDGIDPIQGFPLPVKAVKRIAETSPLPMALVEHTKTVFGQSILVEVNRGCGHGCKFCTSGWIHGPVRHRSFELFSIQMKDKELSGKTVGLIGSDLAGHPELLDLLNFIVDKGGNFSLSSIRPEGLTPALIKLIAATGQKTITLAPETASPRMKKIIGKPLSNDLFFEKIESLVANGIPNVRFYFMVGLPTETDDDVFTIVDFVSKARRLFVSASRPKKKIGKMSVQINAFVPKPWTPFQWVAMESPKSLQRKIRIIRDGLAGIPNLVVRAESVRDSVLQGYVSRGDRQLGSILYEALRQQRSMWDVLKQRDSRPDHYVFREREPDEIFPWDVVDHGINKTVLRKIFDKALSGQ